MFVRVSDDLSTFKLRNEPSTTKQPLLYQHHTRPLVPPRYLAILDLERFTQQRRYIGFSALPFWFPADSSLSVGSQPSVLAQESPVKDRFDLRSL